MSRCLVSRAGRSHKDFLKKNNSSQRELGPPVVEIEFNVDFGRFCGGRERGSEKKQPTLVGSLK